MGKDIHTKHETSAKFQYLAALVVNILPMTYGVVCGWASPNIILLTSDESPLPTGPISMNEASTIASLICVGGLLGNLFFGFITSKFGRKLPLMIIAIPSLISWSLILFAQNVNYLYASRVMSGFVGGGIFVMVPLYLSEIASDRVRGVLGSTLVLTANMGILLAFVLGNYCDYSMTPKVVIAFTVLFEVLFFFFPESPSFLMKQNKVPDAEKSIQFYQNMRGKNVDYELVQQEITKLKNTIGDAKSDIPNERSFGWSDLINNPGKKAMIIGIVLAALNQLCGCFAMLNYTATIFKEAGSSMSPNMSAIVVGVIQLLGSYAATNLVDRAGRKFLFAVSTIGTGLGLVTLGVYMMLKTWGYDVEAFDFIPITSFSFVIFIASWAMLTLPFLVISEIMPEKLKDFGVSSCMTLLWTISFFVIKFLPLLNETFALHGTMYLFACVCFSSALFIILYMPETKGKSYDQIMDSLR